MRKVYAVILASGTGERFGYHIPRQFIKVAGKTKLNIRFGAGKGCTGIFAHLGA